MNGIDLMTMQSAAATGGLDFAGGAAMWTAATGLVGLGFAGVLWAAVRAWSRRREVPRWRPRPAPAPLLGPAR